MNIRDSFVRKIYKILASLKNKSEACLTLAEECSTIDDKIRALCGISRHTASSENYFIDTYRNITSSQPLVMNVKGQTMNVLPLQQAQAKKSWECNTLCTIDDPFLIDRYEKFLQTISTCTLNKIPQLLEKIHTCTIKNLNKKGHAHACYIDTKLCKAMFLCVQILSPHFPKVRHIKRLIYQITSFYRKMLNLQKALTSADLDTLNEIITLEQEKANMYKHQQSCTILSDDDIISRYSNAFKAFTKRCMDTPRYVCASCERLCYKRSVSEINKLKTQLDIPIWRDLMAHLKKHNIIPQYICRYCAGKFHNGLMPAYCVLNDRFVRDTPEEISSLNTFEKIFIQRAKAFQTVVKMGTVINKKLPHRNMVQKVKGRTFHLPLPLQETWNKLCSDTDPINKNHEMYFVRVRGVPTKSKIVWEEYVDRKKVHKALTWLKRNNPFYNNITLSETHDGLCLEKLDNNEFEAQETENDSESVSDNEQELSPKVPMEKTKNNVDAILSNDEQELSSKVPMEETKNNNVDATSNNQREAMLTQILDESQDSYYEQYTIYPLYEKKSCQSATALYQMLKVQDLPLDNREKSLDLLCFPDLFPFGVNGQRETRQVKLHSHEFIKCCLTSKHSQFRLSPQFLFFLLNDANIRQLSRGIYHKLYTTDSRERYTAKKYLEALQKGDMESDLSSIFSTLRNTEQYWRRPRSDLIAMTQEYGPAAWFFTVSPGEWMWEDLGAYIREVNGWPNDSTPISVLVAKDPVSTSRFLDNKFKALLDFICSKDHPIGEVTHYFWRREYQGESICINYTNITIIVFVLKKQDVKRFVSVVLDFLVQLQTC
ncbi:uncharacterized protein LOC143903224 [Temnothorax americanus]|uniref:uncharacterized protein LOC143903224 n=1 Tax=Temnothorax americanus TaxID=1964332 RepID=UPI0040678CC8